MMNYALNSKKIICLICVCFPKDKDPNPRQKEAYSAAHLWISLLFDEAKLIYRTEQLTQSFDGQQQQASQHLTRNAWLSVRRFTDRTGKLLCFSCF
jgi:hypothetical protein